VAQELAESGFKNVHPLYGGFDEWEKAGLPLDSK
jgi:rhodanese-related sulfurtransferase